MNDRRRVIVLIDASNYHYGLAKLGWLIDYAKFVKYLKANHNIVDIYFYGGIHSKKSFFDKHPRLDPQKGEDLKEFSNNKWKKINFFHVLKSLGIIVKKKPISSIYDNIEGCYRRKCNCDVELTIDALDRIDDYDEIILCSGDGDFSRLIRYLKYKGKKAIVIALKDRISWVLKKAAHSIIHLNALRTQIEMTPNNSKGSTEVEPRIRPE